MLLEQAKRRIISLIVSGTCGAVFATLPYALERKFETLADLLWFPGAVIASLLFPEGIHTGSGSPWYPAFVIFTNFLFYSGLAFLIGVGLARIVKRAF